MELQSPGKKELRQFGEVMAAAVMLLAMVRWWLDGFTGFPAALPVVAAAFLLAGLALPATLRPVYWLWMRLALALNYVVTRVILVAIFATMIVPGRLVLLARRRDPLKRKWDRNAKTYWEEPEDQPAEFERYLNQF